MSYPQQGNMIDFFRPVIAEAGTSSKPFCAMDIGAASATHGEWVCMRACKVKALLFALTLEAASGTVTAPTVVFAKRITPGSDTGLVAMGTITVPSGTALGKVMHKPITPVNFNVGDTIKLSWTIGTGTPTGIGDPDVFAELDPEVAGNNSDMIASA